VGQSERRCFRPGGSKTEFFKDCPTCPEMVLVPAGHFAMGSPAAKSDRRDRSDRRTARPENGEVVRSLRKAGSL
jgi:formylglycine-generating enzyme required for sulfatase activity